MIKIKINITYYSLNISSEPVIKSFNYYYPKNQGIDTDEEGNIFSYYDKNSIESFFKNIDKYCNCYLDNTISISVFSESRFNKFVRLIKINNLLYDNHNR